MFIKAGLKMKKGSATFIRDEESFMRATADEFEKTFPEGSRVLIKLHMGEPGNRHYIKADLAARIISALKDCGCSPFVFDTPVVYNSPRNNPEGYKAAAAAHGYSENALGVPVVISDESVKVSGEHMDYHLATEPLEADGVLLLTHFKGHMCSGIGGSIKNVGMGCMSKETKGAIHTGAEPVYGDGCTGCGECVEKCPTDNIRLSDGRPWFDANWCPGCSNCVYACSAECIRPRAGTFDTLLAEAAVTAHERFARVYAINVLQGMTQLCDCVAESGPVLTPDLGFVSAPDMLTADIASMRVLSESTGKEDIFLEHNKVSSWRHIRECARILGRDMDVDIVTLP